MIEIKFDIKELAFLMECINQVTIRGADAPFVTGVINKIQLGVERINIAKDVNEIENPKPQLKK